MILMPVFKVVPKPEDSKIAKIHMPCLTIRVHVQARVRQGGLLYKHSPLKQRGIKLNLWCREGDKPNCTFLWETGRPLYNVLISLRRFEQLRNSNCALEPHRTLWTKAFMGGAKASF